MKNKKFSGVKIAFFEHRPDIATNPSLICLMEELTNAGASVDVFMPRYGNYPNLDSHFSIYPFPITLNLWGGTLRRTLSNWKHFIISHTGHSYHIFKKNKYDLFFGINSEGIIAATKYAKIQRVPTVYLSYEIFFQNELSTWIDRQEKKKEVLSSKLAQLIIIQDELRADLLAHENNIDEKKFAYLPVAPRLAKNIIKSQYLRKKYNIPENKFIVLHSGSFADWTYADELLENVVKWPDNAVLVIHTRYRPNLKDKHINLIRKENLNNIILCTDPLSSIEYERMVCSADIGLVLYKCLPPSKYLQKNIETIGLSSGKFSYYSKYGLPIISIKQKTYAKLLKEYKYGYNLNTFKDIPESLLNIMSDYDKFSIESNRLFNEKLAFDLYWPKISYSLSKLLH